MFRKLLFLFISFALLFYCFNLNSCFANDNHLIINEILISTDGESKKEFIELYNPGNENIDLDGYSLKKKTKSGTESNLVSSSKFIGSIPPLSYFVISYPDYQNDFNADLVYSGSTYSISNNNTILLYDNNDNLIDKVGYGEVSDYESMPTINPDTGVSVGRNDFADTDNNSDDFFMLDVISPGSENKKGENSSSSQGDPETEDEIENLNEEENSAQAPIDPDIEVFDFSQDIIFSEIFPNPVGLDGDKEWIEIYNRGERTVSLYGWTLSDNDGVKYIFPKIVISSKEYLVITKKESGISLNNKEDTIFIYQPFKDEFLQRVKYEKAPEGESYNYLDYKWIWNNNLTPGEKNKIEYKNTLPVVDFYYSIDLDPGVPIRFDSSDTQDKDGDDLRFFWDFGDGFVNNLSCPEHTFLNSGRFVVKLFVFDGTGTSSTEKEIIIGNENELINVLGWDGEQLVMINELSPNPNGSDENEFIELYNMGDQEINLLGWVLDDEDGGSKPYKFNEDTWIGPEEYLLVERKSTKIALNNDKDSVRLFNSNEELIDEVGYENVIEGNTYARGLNNKWFWTTEATPGEENFIEFAEEYKNDNFLFIPGEIKQEIPFITIGDVREQNVGNKVRVSGIVSVLPGVLGSQYFYITEQSGVQIYNYKKDFPDLRVGNIVEVTGEISMINDEYRIKTRSKDDIIILDEVVDIEPLELSCSEISIDLIGGLIMVSGEVIERKGCSVYLDDGSDEAKIYIKNSTGIDYKNIKTGDWLSVTGIIGGTKSGLRILPRSGSDIEKQEIIVKGEESEVVGEVPFQKEWSLETRKKTEWYKYLLVIMGGILIFVGGWYLKK